MTTSLSPLNLGREAEPFSSRTSQEIPFQDLGDIKANSINEWVAIPAVQRSIVRHFKNFLMTYVDENGASVYGNRIKVLGEGELELSAFSSFLLRELTSSLPSLPL